MVDTGIMDPLDWSYQWLPVTVEILEIEPCFLKSNQTTEPSL